jgi:hypothetical protein
VYKAGKREEWWPSKIWKTPHHRKKLFSPRNPLKNLKTTKEMFAKIWRNKQKFAKICKKSLETHDRFE